MNHQRQKVVTFHEIYSWFISANKWLDLEMVYSFAVVLDILCVLYIKFQIVISTSQFWTTQQLDN